MRLIADTGLFPQPIGFLQVIQSVAHQPDRFTGWFQLYEPVCPASCCCDSRAKPFERGEGESSTPHCTCPADANSVQIKQPAQPQP